MRNIVKIFIFLPLTKESKYVLVLFREEKEFLCGRKKKKKKPINRNPKFFLGYSSKNETNFRA